jgi:probable O-glycosylation ligase (exosortase A-associated)
MVYYGLLLFFILEYVRPTSYIPALNALHLNSLVPLAIVAGTLFGRGRITNQEALREPNTKIILALMALIVGSILTADVTLYSFNVFTMVVGYVLVMWVITKQLTDLRQIKGVFKTLVFVHLIVAALTPQIFTNAEVRHYIASGSFLGDGNDFALSVNLTIPFCLFLLFDAESFRHKLLYAVVLLVLVFCVVGTSSRGGTLALACVAFYYWVKTDKKVMTAFVAAVAVGLVLVYAPPTYFERMQTIKSHADGSSQGRILAWKAGVRMALDHPILGVGAGHFPVKYGVEYRPPGITTEIPWQTAHSIYFVILGELGFPGLAVLLTFIISNLVANRRLAREIKARGFDRTPTELRLLTSLSASLMAYAVGGAFLTAIYYPHMYILAGLLVVGRRLVRERYATSEEASPELWGSTSAYPLAAR